MLAKKENREKTLLGWSIGHFEADIILRWDKWYEYQPESLIQNEMLKFCGTRQFNLMWSSHWGYKTKCYVKERK